MPARHIAVLYTRANCELCGRAETWLRELAPALGLTVELVDIEADDELLQRYLFEIPVVTVDGREVARAPIRSKAALADALQEGLSPAPAESGEGIGG